MMKKVIRLTESELIRFIKRIIKEDSQSEGPEMPETPPQEYLDLIASNDEKNDDDESMKQQVAENRYRKNR